MLPRPTKKRKVRVLPTLMPNPRKRRTPGADAAPMADVLEVIARLSWVYAKVIMPAWRSRRASSRVFLLMTCGIAQYRQPPR